MQRVKKMDKCCLCRKDLSVGVAYKKRKKLHGESASVARTMLNEFCVLEIGAGLDDYLTKVCFYAVNVTPSYPIFPDYSRSCSH